MRWPWKLSKSYQHKTRDTFSGADGWVQVVNRREVTLQVLIEPWAMSHELASGESCYVHLIRDGNEITLELNDEFIVAFCADAIYQYGSEVWDFSDPIAEQPAT